LRKLEEIKPRNTEAITKVRYLKVKIEILCEPGDYKRVADFLGGSAK
jgi:hypothetical protein